MRPVLDAPEAPPVDVAVDLRRRQRAMPEQLLDHAKVGAALEQMGRERVAEAVWVRNESPQRARVEPPTAGGDEERVLGAGRELRAAVAEVEAEPVGRLLAERDDPLLVSLAAHVDGLGVEVGIREIEVHGLLAAEP